MDYDGPERRKAEIDISELKRDVKDVDEKLAELSADVKVLDSLIKRDLEERNQYRKSFSEGLRDMEHQVNGQNGLNTEVKLLKEKVAGMLKLIWTAVTAGIAGLVANFLR
jgi:chromosome segregation ATPase